MIRKLKFEGIIQKDMRFTVIKEHLARGFAEPDIKTIKERLHITRL